MRPCAHAPTGRLHTILATTGNRVLREPTHVFRRCLLRLSLEPQPLEDLLELLLVNGLPCPAIQLVNAAKVSDINSSAA